MAMIEQGQGGVAVLPTGAHPASARPAETALQTPARARALANRRHVALWLFSVCALIGVMILVGGATRLTDSGLSITEWKPVTGIVPPLTEQAWEIEKEKYRQIPEYQLVNKGMSMAEFKVIYYWEWGHRVLGRLIGLAFFVPLVVFLFLGKIERRHRLPLFGLFLLGGFQGFLGWYMVASGLTERVDVSQYRLAAHLGMAFLIYGLLFSFALKLMQPYRTVLHREETARFLPVAWVLLGAIFLQIVYGAFVAGTDAGYTYNTWPRMDGQLLPTGLFPAEIGLKAAFEDPLTIQFLHRSFAYAIGLAGLAFVSWVLVSSHASPVRGLALWFGAALAAQIVIGIAAVLAIVPIWLGLLHQAGGVVLFTIALACVARLSIRVPQHLVRPASAPA